MKIILLVSGRAKKSPHLDLFHHYIKRIDHDVIVKEYDYKKAPPNKRQELEKQWIFQHTPPLSPLICMDQTGKLVTSQQFSQAMDQWAERGRGSITFSIGGDQGHDPMVLEKAHAIISFGRITWPHMLMRSLLAEQIFRAQCIAHNHPYHRS